jgi:hypothetical protein
MIHFNMQSSAGIKLCQGSSTICRMRYSTEAEFFEKKWNLGILEFEPKYNFQIQKPTEFFIYKFWTNLVIEEKSSNLRW